MNPPVRSLSLAPSLDGLRFDNRFVQELPADPEPRNTRRQVHGAAYSRVAPALVARPTLVAYSREMAAELGLAPEACETAAFAEVFAGNRRLPGMDPHATCYGGHQFGHWAGQLGDGRAINLGEVPAERGGRWTLQLKGAGPTPYSRSADGLAVLRSSVREFLCSEAMHHLGVPTTRALSLVLTGETVIRDMFYDGHPRPEPGAVVCRAAPSFTRFGHFELPAARGDLGLLRSLADYTLRHDFPHLGEPSPATYVAWFAEVCRRTADLMVHWQRVGFVHGVMNTDNLSILGLTIDYGPYGWLEDYDPDWTPNTTDAQGRRYRFGHQPGVAGWNLAQLANALYPLIGEVEPLQAAMNAYGEAYERGYDAMMAAKLGLAEYDPGRDADLVGGLLALLPAVETDMTLFFRHLADVGGLADAAASDADLLAPLAEAWYRPDRLSADDRARTARWLRDYRARLRSEGVPDAVRRARMNAVNPRYVLRNYLAQLAIDRAEQGDFAGVRELLDVLRRPYEDQPGREAYAQKRPDWARHRAGCSMLSCSS
jgi:uncharacterized protein YdiU (UPF0061 family)